MVIDILSLPDNVEEPEVFETSELVTPVFKPYKLVEDRDLPEIDRSEIHKFDGFTYFRKRVQPKLDEMNSPKDAVIKHRQNLFKNYTKSLKLEENHDKENNSLEVDKKETASQRLRRLLYEIRELEEVLTEKPITTSIPNTSTETDLEPLALRNQVLGIRHKAIIANARTTKDPNAASSEIGSKLLRKLNVAFLRDPNEQFQPRPYDQQVNQALELETRVTSLENLLGAETLIKAELPHEFGLIRLIQEMEKMLELISQPDHLTEQHGSIKQLILELDRLTTLKTGFQQLILDKVVFNEETQLDSATKHKIDRMYKLYEQFDTAIAVAPQLSGRLKHLSHMHQQLLSLSPTLKTIELKINSIKENSMITQSLCKDLIQQLGNDQLTVNSKLKQLDLQMNELLNLVDGFHA